MFNLVAFRLQCFDVSVYEPGEHDSSVMLAETHRFAIGTEMATHSSVVYLSIAHWNAGLTHFYSEQQFKSAKGLEDPITGDLHYDHLCVNSLLKELMV